MNRRELLAASTASALLGVGGCIDTAGENYGAPDRSDESSGRADETDVPGCTRKEEWTDEIASGPKDPDPDSIAGRRDCADAARPEPTGDVCTTFEVEDPDGGTEERHSVGVAPYPDTPDSFDEESVTSFVSEYEEAYAQNSSVENYGEALVKFTFTVHGNQTRVLDFHDDITVVRIEYGLVPYYYRDGSEGHDDNYGEAAVYGVDETGVVRTETGSLGDEGPDEITTDTTPDPVEEGTLLECF